MLDKPLNIAKAITNTKLLIEIYSCLYIEHFFRKTVSVSVYVFCINLYTYSVPRLSISLSVLFGVVNILTFWDLRDETLNFILPASKAIIPSSCLT